ncbi:DUF421 domain-containing protein [Halobacillus karajensis]|uniref:DUF421 domain-containing protein n=1 Tax=Halobacillus karajensis TaxID=195088 RepID=A0A024P638_9BACI|nr:DUF421 domain-containing protein [Halobacillus karajensis]CDQ20718.1 hypothetical protein BN982_03073 [Halobacillus karajensis]CDQ23812.1 hypothetical protein BN983_02063 [Halobacillus karajensis]CDQ27290.1 hypothetical protein BN981_01544 [Halobacillus karajensis]
MTTSEIIWRVTLSFLVLFILTRMMGRKEISQMTFFNFVSAISIGSITANLAVNANLSVRNGVIALVLWTAFTLLIAFIDIKSKRARKFTTGEPIIVIKEGRIMEDALRSTQLEIDALRTLLRQKNIFTLKDVQFAIFETSGQLSVMKYENNQPVTKKDLNILPKNNIYPLATEVITDGKINTNNLQRLGKNKDWLYLQLQNMGIKDIDQIFYAEVLPNGSLYIDKKDDTLTN